MQPLGKRRGLWTLVALGIVLGATWLAGSARLRRSDEPSAYSSASMDQVTSGMRRFLRTEVARSACCARQSYWEAALRQEATAVSLRPDDRAVLEHLRASSYLFFLAGNPERARRSMITLAERAREQGATIVASSAYLEAAQLAIWAESAWNTGHPISRP